MPVQYPSAREGVLYWCEDVLTKDQKHKALLWLYPPKSLPKNSRILRKRLLCARIKPHTSIVESGSRCV